MRPFSFQGILISVLGAVVVALAVLRISYLLVEEEGPFMVFVRLRHALGVRYDAQSNRYATNELGKLFTCIYCLSIWVGLIAALLCWFLPTLTFWLALPFAFSAVAIVLGRQLDG